MGGRYGGDIRDRPPTPPRGRGWWLRPRDESGPGDRHMQRPKK